MMTSFELYFSDLNESAQKRLLKAAGAKDPKEMNWDMDILPIASIDFELETAVDFESEDED